MALFSKSTLETLQAHLRKANQAANDHKHDLDAAAASHDAAKLALDDILDESEALAATARLTVLANRKRKATEAHATALEALASAQAAVDIEQSRVDQERRDLELAQSLEAASTATYRRRTEPLARKAVALFDELQATLNQIDQAYQDSVAASEKLAAAGWPVPEAKSLSPGHRIAPIIRAIIEKYPSEQVARNLNQIGASPITPQNIQVAVDFAKRFPGIPDQESLEALLGDRQLSEMAAAEVRLGRDPQALAARKRQEDFRVWRASHAVPYYVSQGLRTELYCAAEQILKNLAYASESGIESYKATFAKYTDPEFEKPTGVVEIDYRPMSSTLTATN